MMWMDYNGERYYFDYRFDNTIRIDDAMAELFGADYDPVQMGLMKKRPTIGDYIVDFNRMNEMLYARGVVFAGTSMRDFYIPKDGHMVKVKLDSDVVSTKQIMIACCIRARRLGYEIGLPAYAGSPRELRYRLSYCCRKEVGSDYYIKRPKHPNFEDTIDMYLYDLSGSYGYGSRDSIIGRSLYDVYSEYRRFVKLQMPTSQPVSISRFYDVIYEELYIVIYNESTFVRLSRPLRNVADHIIHDRNWLNEIEWRQEATARGISCDEYIAKSRRKFRIVD